MAALRSLRTTTALDMELMEKVQQLSELANTGATQHAPNMLQCRTEQNDTWSCALGCAHLCTTCRDHVLRHRPYCTDKDVKGTCREECQNITQMHEIYF